MKIIKDFIYDISDLLLAFFVLVIMCFVLSIHFYGIFNLQKTQDTKQSSNIINNINNEIEEQISNKNNHKSESNSNNDIKIDNSSHYNSNSNSNSDQSSQNNSNDTSTNSIFSYNLKSGSTASKVANELYEQNIISSKDEFLKLLKNKNLENSLKVGEYKIKQGSSISDIITILTK
ncbi:hypothetical protein WG909_13725 [Peptostreptococcaceae bacterium AGR-M142]